MEKTKHKVTILKFASLTNFILTGKLDEQEIKGRWPTQGASRGERGTILGAIGRAITEVACGGGGQAEEEKGGER